MNTKANGATTDALPMLVQETLQKHPESIRHILLELRALIFQVHQEDADLGELEEVLRWNELSYLTSKPVTGSMIRLGVTKSGKAALFFHCGTTLVERFREQYTHLFEFEKNRAVVLTHPVDDTQAELKNCIRQALRYKLKG